MFLLFLFSFTASFIKIYFINKQLFQLGFVVEERLTRFAPLEVY